MRDGVGGDGLACVGEVLRSTLQSLHRYHVDICQCGKRAITGGGFQPRILPDEADTDSATRLLPEVDTVFGTPRSKPSC
jgi:hypothetical protein